MSYISEAQVRTESRITYDQLGFVSDAAYGSYITNDLIPRTQDLIDHYVGHDFNSTAGTIVLDGSGKETQHISRMGLVNDGATGNFIPPRLLPVPLISITYVSIDSGANISGSCQVYDSYITYEDNCFDVGRQNIEIRATWGYGTIPYDVQYVTAQVCSNALRNMLKRWIAPQEITRIIMGGRSTGGMRGFYAEDIALTDGMKERLDRYRFTEFGFG